MADPCTPVGTPKCQQDSSALLPKKEDPGFFEQVDFTAGGKQSEAYGVAKFVKEAGWRPLFGIASHFRARQYGQNYAAWYDPHSETKITPKMQDHRPDDRIFTKDKRAQVMYDTGRKGGRAARRYFLPPEYRSNNLNYEQRQKLRASSSRNQRRFSRIATFANIVRLAGDGTALGMNEMSEKERDVIILDAATSLSFIGVQTFHAVGSRLNERVARGRTNGDPLRPDQRKLQNRSFRYNRMGKAGSFIANTLQGWTGVEKLLVEMERYESNPESASISAIVDASADIAASGAGITYNFYVFGSAQAAARGGNLTAATDMLSTNMRHMPILLAGIMRLCTFIMAGISARESAAILGESYDPTLTDEEQTKMRVNAYTGFVLSLMMAYFGTFVRSASTAVGIAGSGWASILVGALMWALTGFQILYNMESDSSDEEQMTRWMGEIEKITGKRMTPTEFLGQYLTGEAYEILTGYDETAMETNPGSGVWKDHHGIIVPSPPVWGDELDCKETLPTGKPLEFACIKEGDLIYNVPEFPKVKPEEVPEIGIMLVYNEGIEGPPVSEGDLGSYEMVFMVRDKSAASSARQ